ncbi:Cytochrome c oxidase assembly protein cox19 [Savitreella phatthalungensis]
MSLGGPRQSKNPTAPPERGSFPLDHAGDCRDAAQEYLACVKQHRGQNNSCRALAKRFLQCRMDHGLMMKDSFHNLGFCGDQASDAGGS